MKLNKRNLYKWERKFGAKKDNLPVKFHIGSWIKNVAIKDGEACKGGNPCGTSACIAGEIYLEKYAHLIGDTSDIWDLPETSGSNFLRIVSEEFGLDVWDTERLCDFAHDTEDEFWLDLAPTRFDVANALRFIRIEGYLPRHYSKVPKFYSGKDEG